ncbi:MAG TPA: histone deacetylase [Salinivirga sp.]|uniref:histone deacetylase family protein n=1 Tax=Salinivirga sp. TaxID=1970192 RepID=UPI002B49CF07|nr:histone deacetylase [Salinivirga sp.]HKK60300.1 histone deacetylase [Salinivirga sp.]
MIQIFFDEKYHLELPPKHRFPMDKYRLTKAQLIYEGTFTESNFISPKPATQKQLVAIHDQAYIDKLNSGNLTRHEIRRSGFPYSRDLVLREESITGGTIAATYAAMKEGVSFNLAGGTHHAYPDHAEGFCIYNDIAVAARDYLHKFPNNQILVVDLDVHQGNGTAHIFKDEPRVFTLSVHGEKNYPMHKEQSDLDIPLSDTTTDRQYLEIVQENLVELIDRVKPDFIYFQSGVDILVNDKLGKVSISMSACRERDMIVFETLYTKGIPTAVSMGGGYADRLRDIVEAHCNTFRVAKHLYE